MSDRWRAATPADTAALADLERAANLVALGHVFPPADHPFPYDAVLARWASVLADDLATVSVVDGGAGLAALLAHDPTRLRHLAVHPDHWGSGLARTGVERAVAAGSRRLWCLVENHRARGLYEHLGWAPTGLDRRAEWPPYPVEMEYAVGDPGR